MSNSPFLPSSSRLILALRSLLLMQELLIPSLLQAFPASAACKVAPNMIATAKAQADSPLIDLAMRTVRIPCG
jgi:hypothetical protein